MENETSLSPAESKKTFVNNHVIKSNRLHKKHFIERVKERYGFTISSNAYKKACVEFKGVFSKTNGTTVGYCIISQEKVWCLYSSDLKILKTAYPKEIEHDAKELIRCCFSTPVRQLAFVIYEKYLEEKSEIHFDSYRSNKDAAKYFFSNKLFPTLHIDFYKYKSVDLFKIIHQINLILAFKSQYVAINIQRIYFIAIKSKDNGTTNKQLP